MKSKQQRLKEKLWKLCKEIVRTRDSNICLICNKSSLERSNWHTGHLIPSSACGAYLRYDIRNLHSSCYRCNINLGGNGALFYIQVLEKYGIKFIDKLFLDKNKIIKADNIYYESLIDEYVKIQKWSKIELFDYTKNFRKRKN